jgi:hypothetical protein
LIEPKFYADYLENLLGEINRRLIDRSGDVSELWHNLICKSISSKKFLIDKNRLQMKFFLQMQLLYLEEELGKRLQIAQLPAIINMLNRYQIRLADSFLLKLNDYI